MNPYKLVTYLLLAPIATCLAQAPAPPKAVATPKPAATPKAAIALEDIPGSDPVVITVGDDKMTKSEFERILASLPDPVRARTQTPDGKRKIADQIVQIKALAQEARKRGVDKRSETQEQVRVSTDGVLAGALYREIAAGIKPDDAAAHTYYDQHKSEYEQVTASHILIRFKGSGVPAKPGAKDLTEAEALAKAQEVRKRILAGEDFAKVATAESDDTQSAEKGGLLGEAFGHGRMVPAFEEVAFKLPVGEVSEPVKTQFGYHLIKVTKHENKPFEEMKASIEQRLKPDLAQQAVDNIKKQASVTLNESYFGK